MSVAGLHSVIKSIKEDDSVDSESLMDYDVTDIQSTVKEKKKYFEEKSFFWDSDLMFRVWRMTFLDLMKKDGFTKQVKDFNDIIRQRNEQKRLKEKRKKYGNDIGAALHSLDNAYAKNHNSYVTNKTVDREKTIVKNVQQILRSASPLKNNKSSASDFKTVTEAIETGLRGYTISNEKMMRDLIDSVKSTLGVHIIYDRNASYYNGNERKYNQRDAYEKVMQLVGYNNGTSKHLDELSRSDIGFIVISEHKEPNSSRLREGKDPLQRRLYIRGESTDGKRTLSYKNRLSGFINLMHDVDNDDFYTEKVHYELIRRAIKNQWLLHSLGIYGYYQKIKQQKENSLLNETHKNESPEKYNQQMAQKMRNRYNGPSGSMPLKANGSITLAGYNG